MVAREQPTARGLGSLAVGEVFETRSETLTIDTIVAFAREFDPQPMHMDETAARDTVFRGLVASGWHVAALTMRLVVDARPFGTTPLVGLGIEGLQFRRAVRPNTTLRCRATIAALQAAEKPGKGYVTMAVETLDAATDEVLVVQQWKLLVPA